MVMSITHWVRSRWHWLSNKLTKFYKAIKNVCRLQVLLPATGASLLSTFRFVVRHNGWKNTSITNYWIIDKRPQIVLAVLATLYFPAQNYLKTFSVVSNKERVLPIISWKVSLVLLFSEKKIAASQRLSKSFSGILQASLLVMYIFCFWLGLKNKKCIHIFFFEQIMLTFL